MMFWEMYNASIMFLEDKSLHDLLDKGPFTQNAFSDYNVLLFHHFSIMH